MNSRIKWYLSGDILSSLAARKVGGMSEVGESVGDLSRLEYLSGTLYEAGRQFSLRRQRE